METTLVVSFLLFIGKFIQGQNTVQSTTDSELSWLTSQVVSLVDNNARLTNRINAQQEEIRELRTQQGQIRNAPVGFTAATTHSKSLGAWQVVPFDKILYSTGNDFDLSTNKFTCPINGSYVVSIDFFTYPGRFFDCYIWEDGAALIRSYTDARHIGGHMGASATIVTECNEGNTIWVTTGGNAQGNYLYENAANTHYNRFSVFRL